MIQTTLNNLYFYGRTESSLYMKDSYAIVEVTVKKELPQLLKNEPFDISILKNTPTVAFWVLKTVHGFDDVYRLKACDIVEHAINFYKNEIPELKKLKVYLNVARKYANNDSLKWKCLQYDSKVWNYNIKKIEHIENKFVFRKIIAATAWTMNVDGYTPAASALHQAAFCISQIGKGEFEYHREVFMDIIDILSNAR